ncbi:hypothetical protein AQS8620_02412 [Aquimixticola soesokkakensis]|uniref:Surface lipoprotein assembly modifier C-terminal domain-containing protein n=1 Tax=Aquimixticola soesokkakensis TaxID=1519096 RepID=A0A1Y5T3L4_9RHOB|nr:porin family protein [Aquimixticola soesokkakensis]SLN55027.1 hypothetical protein AQS8620_02412 [Aquimixticola soesokkakensis]
MNSFTSRRLDRMGRLDRMYRRLCALLAVMVFSLSQSALADPSGSAQAVHAQLMNAGRAALAAGDPDTSLTAFSRALRLAPRDPRAQLAMAQAWAQSGQPRRAEAFLHHLLRDATQQENAALYLAALDELARRYPFQFSASLAFLPSSNIKNTSSETYFDTLWGRFAIEDGGAQTSGVGVDAGAQVLYRRPLGAGQSLEIGANLGRVWYRAQELRYWRGRLFADVTSQTRQTSARAGVHVAGVRFDAGAQSGANRLTRGLHAGWSTRLSQSASLTLSGRFETRAYLDKPALSGPFGALSLGGHMALGPSQALAFGTTIERSTPALAYHRYWGAGLRADYRFDLSDTLRAGIDASATLRRYDTDFPSLDYARRDMVYRVGGMLSDSRLSLMGATPTLSCGYKVQTSNVALYASRTTECRLGWAYRF